MTSQHTGLDVAIALVGGFFASFLTFAVTAYERAGTSLLGQLLAGDPEANRELPTTLNTLQATIGGEDPLVAAMRSYGWWTAVLIGGLIAAAIILKLMRRYV